MPGLPVGIPIQLAQECQMKRDQRDEPGDDESRKLTDKL
jgi:hypothetical protein